jgi:hypothetical protein
LPLFIRRPPHPSEWHLRLALVQRDAHVFGDRVQQRVQCRRPLAQVVVGATTFSIVEGAQQRRPGLVDQPHQSQRLRQHPVEVQLLVLQRERPFDLLVKRWPVEVTPQRAAVESGPEPALVQAHPVRVDAADDVPGVVEPAAQLAVGRQGARQVHGRRPADRFVGVHPAEHHGVMGALAHRQRVDGLPEP